MHKSQILVGILSFISGIGKTIAQIVALGFVFNYLVGMDTSLGMVIGGGIIVSYAAFGGIRAVITTDVIQFIVLVVAIPIMLHTALSHIGGYEPIFNYTANTPISEFDLWGYLLIAVSLCIPRLYPAMIQRCLIAKNTEQLYQSLNMTIIIVSAIYVVMIFSGIVAVYLYPNIENPSHLFAHFVQDLAPVGIKGFIIAGLLAMIMSTADTELNVGSVALVHDVIKKITTSKINEVRLASLTTFVMGGSAVCLAMQFTSILEAMLFAISYGIL